MHSWIVFFYYAGIIIIPALSFVLDKFTENIKINVQKSGPQCTLYVPAPILKQGENSVVCMLVSF
jgi:hypothetical protein